jgi:hypothetical protein
VDLGSIADVGAGIGVRGEAALFAGVVVRVEAGEVFRFEVELLGEVFTRGGPSMANARSEIALVFDAGAIEFAVEERGEGGAEVYFEDEVSMVRSIWNPTLNIPLDHLCVPLFQKAYSRRLQNLSGVYTK